MTDSVRTRVVRWENGRIGEDCADELAREEPLEVRVGGRPMFVTMRTPGNDLELIAGLLHAESLLNGVERPLMRKEGPNLVNVAEPIADRVRLTALARASVVASSCGICGKGSIEQVHRDFPPIDDAVWLTPAALIRMAEVIGEVQPAFARTGGLHAAGLFDEEGALVVAREDVGRHNAVDKVIGDRLLRRRLPLKGHTLMVSGRASFEIVQKALAARIPIVAAVSAPSSLAVELADDSGQTLIGFVRGERFNIYTHAERVRG